MIALLCHKTVPHILPWKLTLLLIWDAPRTMNAIFPETLEHPPFPEACQHLQVSLSKLSTLLIAQVDRFVEGYGCSEIIRYLGRCVTQH